MPELPEVETVVRKLRAANLLGKTIQHAIVYSQSTIANPNSAQFISQIQGQDFKAIERRGKFIVITLGQQTLLIHLRMTGKLFASHEENLSSSQNAIHPHERHAGRRIGGGRDLWGFSSNWLGRLLIKAR